MRAVVLVFLASILVVSLARAQGGRDVPSTYGSTIVPAFSVRSDALEPGSSTQLVACVTNQNPASRRSVEPGDRFTFTFQDGSVADCGALTVHPSSSGFSPSDFSCSAATPDVTLTYVGPARAWPFAAGACATIAFEAPAATTSIVVRRDVRTEGAFTAPPDPVLLLTVAPGLATPGSPGPPGPASFGATAQVDGEGWVNAVALGPPVLVPGLFTSITVQDASRLLVNATVPSFGSPPCPRSEFEAEAWVELDGVLTSRVAYFNHGTVWLSEPLTAGSHAVRIVLKAPDGETTGTSSCGGTGYPLHDARGWLPRLTILEVPSPN